MIFKALIIFFIIIIFFSLPIMLLIGFIGELLEDKFQYFKEKKKHREEDIIYPKEYLSYI